MDLPLGKSAYLICGDDEFRVSLATKELLDRLVPEADRAFGLDQIDGRVGTVDETVAVLRAVRDALVSDSLFGPGSKTVWLREPAFLSNDRIGKSQDLKGDLAELVSRIREGFGEGTHLVVSTLKINRASAFFKAFAGKDCAVADFGSGLKARQKAEAAAELVTDFCTRLKFKMEPDARRLFLARVGTESRQIVSELEKLACYCGEGKAATADDVREIVSSGAVSEVWDFTDAFCTRDPKALVAQVRMQLGQGESAIRLVNSLLTWDSLFMRVGLKVVVLPLIVGVGYEYIMYAGRHANGLTRILSAPGLWMQRLTTREPDEAQLAVAIAALKHAMPDEFPQAEPAAAEAEALSAEAENAAPDASADGK